MPTVEDLEQKIVKLVTERDEKDAEIARTQVLISRLSERVGVIDGIKKQILDFDISAKELFPK